MFWRIQQLTTTVSTNDDAKRAAETGEAEGLVIWALGQTAGKGRHGRVWESPEGNLYCSVLLRPQIKPQFIGQYSFVAALAVYDTARELLPNASITLKWPNDVLVNGKKIAGILLEAGEGWLIIGVGLNVKHCPENALYPATSIVTELNCSLDSVVPLPLQEGLGEGERYSLPDPSPAKTKGLPKGQTQVFATSPARGEGLDLPHLDLAHILEKLLGHLSHRYAVIQSEGFNPIRTVWLEHAQTGAMSVRMPTGNIEGIFAGVDDTGNLCLRLANGEEKAIATGDVFPLTKEVHAARD